jgi:colanic acid/amylovoran biosynthesis glycosyltransferase
MKRDKTIVIHSFPIWLPQTQTWMYNQVKYLPESIDVHVVCEQTQNLNQFSVPNIHCLYESSRILYLWEKGIRRVFLPRYRSFLVSTAKKIRATILHSHFGNIGWLDMDVPNKTGMRHVVTYYGYDVNMLPTEDKRWQSRYQELFDKADLFLCEGPFMAESLIAALGAPRSKVKVHHLGVEIDKIPYRPRSWKENQTLRVLIVASFQEKKGIPSALEALAQLQHKVPLEITIIGDAAAQARSQKEKQRILEIIGKNGLTPRTRLLGFQPYSVIFEEASNHHVFISPSVTASNGDSEGGAPVSIIEMMASGMPVVSTIHCDIPQVVQYGIENWLVPEHDVHELIQRLEWLVEHPAHWESFLKTGRQHVEVEFSAAKQGERLAASYRDVMSG